MALQKTKGASSKEIDYNMKNTISIILSNKRKDIVSCGKFTNWDYYCNRKGKGFQTTEINKQ